MKTVVITGSTRGIGYGLAVEFLKRGHQVVISGRSQKSVDDALLKLKNNFSSDQFYGKPCDISDYKQIDGLWQAAVERFGSVDIWVNNAGMSHPSKAFNQLPAEVIQSVIDTNITGVIFSNQIVFEKMQNQGFGYIYNMEGFGSDGRINPMLSVYGTSKRALRYFTSVAITDKKNSNVKIGTLSPGMVVTDLLIGDMDQNREDWEKIKKIYNILADKVETVTPYLVEAMLKNNKHGAKIEWLTTPKILFRFFSAPFVKREIV